MKFSDIEIQEYDDAGCWVGPKVRPRGSSVIPGEIIDVAGSGGNQTLFVQGEDGQQVSLHLPPDAIRAVRDALSRALLRLQATELDRAVVAVQELRPHPELRTLEVPQRPVTVLPW